MDVGAEHRAVGTAHFENCHAILATYVEFAHGASLQRHASLLGLDPEHEVIDMVFVEQGSQALFLACLLMFFTFFAEEIFAERVEHDQSHAEAYQADGQEVEEGEARFAVVAQVAVDNQVGRSTDQRQDTTHRAGECEGHHQLAGARTCRLGHGEDNRQQQGYRTRVAHKGSHHGSYEHHEEEKLDFARAGQLQQTAGDDFCQAGLEHGSTHDEQANHHHYGRV